MIRDFFIHKWELLVEFNCLYTNMRQGNYDETKLILELCCNYGNQN